jgi:poly-beta-1,6-N-acetyl-D-glucosamine synthase
LASTVLAQTLRPAAWVIVNDGSTDRTGELASELAHRHPWITVVHSGREHGRVADGRREGRALLSFQEGVETLGRPVTLVTKLDADVTLPPRYFEQIAAAFADDARLGIASGGRCELEGGRWRRRHLTGTAVEAACRTYRWTCWQDVQPLAPRMGWDGLDLAHAVVAGWRTLVVPDLEFRHHRPMGGRERGRLRARAAEGAAAHFMAYRPSYLLLRALWHARREPTALAMVWGFAAAVVRRCPQCDDPAARTHVRRQQSARRLGHRLREARGRTP